MANPTLLTSPIAENGDKNVIPASTGATTGLLDQEHGFQQINELPLQAGGLPPQRKDFNGVFNLLSGIDYMTQRGYTFEWDATLPYVVGCIVRDTDGKLYRCVNDVSAGGTAPSLDSTNWVSYDIQDYVGYVIRNTAYSVGDTSTLPLIPAGYFLECTTAGTTSAAAPTVTTPVTAGQTIADGTVVWTVRKNTSIISENLGLNGYIKFSDGFTIQQGYISKDAAGWGPNPYNSSQFVINVALPIALTSTNYTIAYSEYNNNPSALSIGFVGFNAAAFACYASRKLNLKYIVAGY